jgi:hypothetical protein
MYLVEWINSVLCYTGTVNCEIYTEQTLCIMTVILILPKKKLISYPIFTVRTDNLTLGSYLRNTLLTVNSVSFN